MAASVLCRRTAVFCRTLNGISSSRAAIPAHSVLQIASYNPKPLRLNIKDPYIPDKDNERTPKWQLKPEYDRKLYGRYGSASGIDPAMLWPSHEQLDSIIAEEKEWNPPLEVMLKNIEVREAEETAKRRERERTIAENMAKMPQMVAKWRREKVEARQKKKEEKARREKYMLEIRERIGGHVDPRNPEFQQMVEEMEKEEKKKSKLLKRRMKMMQAATAATPPAASPESSGTINS